MVSNTISSGDTLLVGKSIFSSNGKNELRMQEDGNLVLYCEVDGRVKPTWASQTSWGKDILEGLRVQEDGNLVLMEQVRDGAPKICWQSRTKGNGSVRLVVLDEGNLVLYNSDSQTIWSSNPTKLKMKSNKITSPALLPIGESIFSSNRRHELRMQGDGNLVLYYHDGVRERPTWSSQTFRKRINQGLQIKGDGNMILDDEFGRVWESNTGGNDNVRLKLKDDGNLLLSNLRTGEIVWASYTVNPQMARSVIRTGDSLAFGSSLFSDNETYELRMQCDGNLVLYRHEGDGKLRKTWESGTSKKGVAHGLIIQRNGNMVLSSRSGRVAWESRTDRDVDYVALVLEDDGKLVLVDCTNGKELWSSTLDDSDKSSSQLSAPGHLSPGKSIFSSNGKNELRMQRDRNLVLYWHDDGDDVKATWSSNTFGKDIRDHGLIVERHGNLILRASNGRPVWESNTADRDPDVRLCVQDDGDLVLKNSTSKPIWATGTVNREATSNTISIGEKLGIGESIFSPNRKNELRMQSDGNLMLYWHHNGRERPTWATRTDGIRNVIGLYLEADGNMILKDESGDRVWESRTSGNHDVRLEVQDDGNLVLLNNRDGTHVWATGTAYF